MFNMTGSEIVVILLLALVVLGPEKLPDAVRRFGRTYAELKRMSSGFQSEFRAAIEEPVREMRDTADMLGRSAQFGGDVDAPEPTSDLPFAEPASSVEPGAGWGSEPSSDSGAGEATAEPGAGWGSEPSADSGAGGPTAEPGAGWGSEPPAEPTERGPEPDESSGTERP